MNDVSEKNRPAALDGVLEAKGALTVGGAPEGVDAIALGALAASLAAANPDRPAAILHVARDRSHYDAGHIPGARYLAFSDLVITRDGIANELPPTEQLKAAFTRLGIGDRAVAHAQRALCRLDQPVHVIETFRLLDAEPVEQREDDQRGEPLRRRRRVVERAGGDRRR